MRTDRNKLIFEIQDNFIPCSGIFSDPFEKEAQKREGGGRVAKI